ncbi:hypothetical protein GCM10010384_39480 [Streptomyces djakartensis]|uniref:Uncharacterized protein n=1 Tax=Streptomyces djakartensis TaxID=68193 RepID=A0ABQ2ZZX3_9ACTN|nr:hypothetical protein GCM10010384_39480 [Streptomyces djakartensis]
MTCGIAGGGSRGSARCGTVAHRLWTALTGPGVAVRASIPPWKDARTGSGPGPVQGRRRARRAKAVAVAAAATARRRPVSTYCRGQ